MSGRDGKTVMAGPATRSKRKNEDVTAAYEEIKDGKNSAVENEETMENPKTNEVPTKRRKTESAAGQDSSIEPGSGSTSPIEVISIGESSDGDDDDDEEEDEDDEDMLEVQVEIDEKTGEYVAYTRDPNAPLPPPKTPTVPRTLASSADPEKLLLAHKWKDFVLAAVQKGPKKELRKGPKKELMSKELKSSKIIGRFKRKSKTFFYENSPATDAGYGVRYATGGPVFHELEESFKPTVEENELTGIFKNEMPYFTVLHSDADCTIGYVKSYNDHTEAIKTFSRCTGIRFVLKQARKDVCQLEFDPSNYKVEFRCHDKTVMQGKRVFPHEDKPMDVQYGRIGYECQFGKERNAAAKRKYRRKLEEKEKLAQAGKKIRRHKASPCTKRGCTAFIFVKQAFVFVDYTYVKSNSPTADLNLVQQIKAHIRTKLELKQEVNIENRIYMHFPTSKHHCNHTVPQVTSSESCLIDKKVEDKIAELLSDGFTRITEVDRQVLPFCKKEFPDMKGKYPRNTPTFPSKETIGICMSRLKMKFRLSRLENDDMAEMVDEWKKKYPDDYFYLRPMTSTLTTMDIKAMDMSAPAYEDDVRYRVLRLTHKSPEKNFLFVHQTKAQRYLLKRYNNLCFLNAAFRTADLEIPLYFLVVKTNVSYACVATFMVQFEDAASITEALEKIKEHLNDVTLKAFMLDVNQAEVEAVRKVFPESEIYISDFHREQAWDRWLSTSSNMVRRLQVHHTDYDELFDLLRNCARAETERGYFDAIVRLHDSRFWTEKFSKVKHWFVEAWEKEPKLWVHAYHLNKGFYLGSNDGMKRMNQMFQYQFLHQHREDFFSKLLRIVVECYVPLQLSVYSRENTNVSQQIDQQFGRYSVPEYLRHRPADFVKHCVQQIQNAGYPNIGMISEIEKRVFKVQGTKGLSWYTVDLSDNKVSCTCDHWIKTEMPCRHIFSVIEHTHLKWKDLAESLRNHPLFTVDSSIRQLVSQDVIVTKDLSDIATYILQELDAPVVEMSDITNASTKRVRKTTTQTTTTTSKSKSKKQQQQHQQPAVEVPADPSYVPSDDDYSSNLDMDINEQQNDEVSLENVTTTIRQLCEEISDATYRATDLHACANLSQTLSEALATFNASIHNHTQEEIVYGQFY